MRGAALQQDKILLVNISDNDGLRPELMRAGFGRIEWVEQTGSTNSDLLATPFGTEPAAPCLRWADHQNAGRGRRGHQWIDEPGGSLTFSVAMEYRLRPPLPSPLPAFTLVAGCSVLRSVGDRLPGLRLQLKWPNDLLLNDGKLAGILVETRQQGGIGRLVVGCGLNLQVPGELPAVAGAWRAVGLRQVAPTWEQSDSTRLVAAIALALQRDFAEFRRDGFDRFRPYWESVNRFANESVALRSNDQEIVVGQCRGVDARGALQIETAGIINSYSVGEISARLSAGH